MTPDNIASLLEAHRRWLSGAPDGRKANLVGDDLRGAYLRGACLAGADLTDADLKRADLTGADLTDADLTDADLKRADLTGADLTDADLKRADLTGADLTDADLKRADLRGAYLRGAYLRGANLDFSVLPLWCGSKGVQVDRRIAAQIAAHFCALDCDDPEYRAARDAVMAFALTSHRAQELGLCEEEAENGRG